MDETLTQKMEAALGIAIRDGAVAADRGEHNGRVEHVAATTIAALIRRGYLTHCYNGNGGLGGRLTEKGALYIPNHER